MKSPDSGGITGCRGAVGVSEGVCKLVWRICTEDEVWRVVEEGGSGEGKCSVV